MARKQFVIVYPDGSKKNVSAFDREQMLLAGEIKKDGDNANRYRFVAQAKSVTVQTFKSFRELANLGPLTPAQREYLQRHYPGLFIFEIGEESFVEIMESAEGLALRLPSIIASLESQAQLV